MANIYGRQVVLPLTNKSGGSVIAGDVVIIDTTTNDSFTTTTSAASILALGVAAETIASNAVGRIIVEGYAPLVNVSASVTRGNYGTTHTVAKQAVESASRVAGTFLKFLKTSATPSALVYPVDLAGAALTNPMNAIGDIIQGTTAGAPARLAAPAAGKVLTGAGVTTPLVYSYPPGYELGYAQITADVTTTSTSAADATGLTTTFTATGGALIVEAWMGELRTTATLDLRVIAYITDASNVIVAQVLHACAGAADAGHGAYLKARLTPAAGSFTYKVRFNTISAGTATIRASSTSPAFIRVSVV